MCVYGTFGETVVWPYSFQPQHSASELSARMPQVMYMPAEILGASARAVSRRGVSIASHGMTRESRSIFAIIAVRWWLAVLTPMARRTLRRESVSRGSRAGWRERVGRAAGWLVSSRLWPWRISQGLWRTEERARGGESMVERAQLRGPPTREAQRTLGSGVFVGGGCGEGGDAGGPLQGLRRAVAERGGVRARLGRGR